MTPEAGQHSSDVLFLPCAQHAWGRDFWTTDNSDNRPDNDSDNLPIMQRTDELAGGEGRCYNGPRDRYWCGDLACCGRGSVVPSVGQRERHADRATRGRVVVGGEAVRVLGLRPM
jgi:hypothetical protein